MGAASVVAWGTGSESGLDVTRTLTLTRAVAFFLSHNSKADTSVHSSMLNCRAPVHYVPHTLLTRSTEPTSGKSSFWQGLPRFFGAPAM